MSNSLQLSLAVLATLILAACGSGSNEEPTATVDSSAATPESPAPQMAALLANTSRSVADKTRDAGRRPADVIEFLGIETGMNVIDVIAGGGYYTEVLSYAVGKNGRVSAQNPAFVLQMRDGANDKALSERLAGDRLANVSRLDRETGDILPEDGPYDAALTALNLHDIYNSNGEEAAVGALKIILAALKPGAVFGLIDHHGAAGGNNKELHRINVDDAIRVAEAAGFIVEAKSGLLHVHSDDLTETVFADGRRGNTHRFLLRLRKPK